VRPVCIFILLFISLGSTAQLEKKVFDENGMISISGRIKNYKPGENNQFIKFWTFSPTGRSKDTSVFIINGKFEVVLPSPMAGDMQIAYHDIVTRIYQRPGEDIKLNFEDGRFKIAGESSEVSRLIMNFESELQKASFRVEPDWKIVDDSIFAQQRLARMDEEIAVLKNFISRNRIANRQFVEWATNDSRYNAGFDILFHCFAGKRDRDMTHAKLLKLIERLPVNNPSAIQNSAYYQFIRLIGNDIQFIINLNPAFDSSINLNDNNRYAIALEKNDQIAYGIAKELLYFNLALGLSSRSIDALWDRLDSSITQPYLKKWLILEKENKDKSFVKFEILKKIKESSVDEKVKRSLVDLFEKRSDEYLFIDFWGTWCGPCMGEMKFYSAFIDSLKTKKISFLFLATGTPESQVHEVKAQYNINGEFVALNTNEQRLLENVFGFSGYPSHFILAPGTIVIDNTIGRIVSGAEVSSYSLQKVRKLVPDK